MAISFNGIGDITATFYGNVEEGDIVRISSARTVSKAVQGGEFFGVCKSKSSDICAVMLRGFVTLGYSGTAPSIGNVKLASAGDNKVKVSSTDDAEVNTLVVDVDTTEKTVTILL